MNAFFINIKNLIPYLLLIVIYFLFINIEAHKKQTNHKNDNNILSNNEINKNNSDIKFPNPPIAIPVIPFNE
tara:strand:- start:912 stop:1127 length:216 start_codon:yes stop_codon:yes gene_type:complete